MKTLYALAFICLSLPAFASNLDLNQQPDEAADTACLQELAYDFDFRGENTAAITVPSIPGREQVLAEIWMGPDSSPGSETPAFGASDVATDHTATVPTAAITVPATPESDEVWAEIWLGPDSSPGSETPAV